MPKYERELYYYVPNVASKRHKRLNVTMYAYTHDAYNAKSLWGTIIAVEDLGVKMQNCIVL